MKRQALVILFLAMVPFLVMGQDANEEVESMRVTVNGRTFSARLEENVSASAFAALLEDDDITLEMEDYGGFEKVGTLDRSLPCAHTSMNTVPGDIVLYTSDQIVVFYGHNRWSYTKIAHVDDAEGLASALGPGKARITFSLD